MTKNDARIMLRSISNELNLYHPTKNNEISAFAHYIKNSVDPEEATRNGEEFFCFEIFTNEILERLKSNQVSEDSHFSYIFSTWLKPDTESYCAMKALSERASKNLFEVKIKEKNSVTTNNSTSINGRLFFNYPIPYKYRTDEIMPLYYEVALIPSDATLGKSTYEFHNEPNNNAIFISESGNNHNINTDTSISFEDSSIDSIEAKVYKVGGANTVYLDYSNGKSILLDCGIDTYDDTPYATSKQHIMSSDVQPTMIIITHWHEDHFNLFFNIDKARLETILVMGYPYNNYYMQSYLDSLPQGMLYYMPPSNVDKMWLIQKGYPETYLFQGLNKKPAPTQFTQLGAINYDNSENDSAIILAIGPSCNRFISPSDVSYYSWPNYPELELSKTKYLLLPHHGGHVYTNIVTAKTQRFATVIKSSNFIQLKDLSTTQGKTFHSSYIDGVFGSKYVVKDTESIKQSYIKFHV